MPMVALKDATALLAACSVLFACDSTLDNTEVKSLNMPVGCFTLYSATTFFMVSVTTVETSLNSAPRLLAPLIALFITVAKGLKSTT